MKYFEFHTYQIIYFLLCEISLIFTIWKTFYNVFHTYGKKHLSQYENQSQLANGTGCGVRTGIIRNLMQRRAVLKGRRHISF